MNFRRELADQVLAGTKTERSPWFRGCCAYTVGQRFAVTPGRGEHRICNAIVTAVDRVRLGDIDDAAARAEGFKNVGDFRRGWEAINGSWVPGESVWLIKFKRAESMAGIKQPEAARA